MESPILEKLFQAEIAGEIFMEFFDLTPPPFVFTANGSQDQTVQVPNDSDFLVRIVNRACMQPAGTYIENPDCTVSIVDSGSGRLFNNSTPPHITAATGTGERPNILPEPRIVSGGNALTVTVVNQSGGALAYLSVSLLGTKIFYRGSFSISDVLGANTSMIAMNAG